MLYCKISGPINFLFEIILNLLHQICLLAFLDNHVKLSFCYDPSFLPHSGSITHKTLPFRTAISGVQQRLLRLGMRAFISRVESLFAQVVDGLVGSVFVVLEFVLSLL